MQLQSLSRCRWSARRERTRPRWQGIITITITITITIIATTIAITTITTTTTIITT
ncbi:hypothetical protein [Mesorhizobium sp.]|uniref:hypothetical protein n=1 Tax=Mesorhizobium sp. TaxID=1871066 RepID=UPI0026003EAA|nr:hypothetical protein [Mesorhizobium sp.]